MTTETRLPQDGFFRVPARTTPERTPAMAEEILPGTYISVRDEGLITAGRIATGIIGIVGTAARGPVEDVVQLGTFGEARAVFGEADPWQGGKANELTLMRALELAFNNGASSVYAVRAAAAKPSSGTDISPKSSRLVLKAGNTNVLTLTARTPGTWGDEIGVKVTTPDPADTKTRRIEITHGTGKESYTGTGAGELVAAIEQDSKLVNATLQGGATALPDAAANADAPPVPLAGGANGQMAIAADYERALEALENEIVNLVVLAGLDARAGAAALQGHLARTAGMRRERIGIIGSNGTDDADAIAAATPVLDTGRLVYVGPGIRVNVTDPATRIQREVSLPGAYTAAAVAGVVSSLPVQASPTNKTVNVPGLAAIFNQPKLEKLVQNRVLAVERREGFRIVQGITTSANPAWKQITTRRIVDFAMYGVRSACNPYIGMLNNVRVRAAMKATLDGFLTRMVQDEALVGYTLDVSATRAQEIAGEAIVTMTLQPTFSIDYIKVTMYLG
jgi:hypothetical protein